MLAHQDFSQSLDIVSPCFIVITMENFVPRSPVLFDDDDSSGVSSNQVALDADEIDAVAANVTDGVDTYESLLAAVTITDIPPTLRSLESAVTVEEIPTTLQSLENAVTVEVNFPTVQSLESAVTVEEISPTIEKLLDEVTLESVSQSRSLASSPATDSPGDFHNLCVSTAPNFEKYTLIFFYKHHHFFS